MGLGVVVDFRLRNAFSGMVAAVVTASVVAGLGCAKAPPPDGRALFQSACARCHSEDGRGGTPSKPGATPPRDLRNPSWQDAVTDDQLRHHIRTDKAEMPPFADVLSPNQLDAVVAHVRSLRSPVALQAAAPSTAHQGGTP